MAIQYDLKTDKQTVVPDKVHSISPDDLPLDRVRFKAFVEILGKDAEIRAAIASLPDPAQRAHASAKYDHSDEYHFSSELTQQIRQMIGISLGDFTTYWLEAANLPA